MAIKIYLTENNNPWGIKQDNGSPKYDHIINFSGDESKRDEFVAINFFNDNTDWKNSVKNSLARGDSNYDANTYQFSVMMREYPNNSWTDIVNKNYAIMYDEATKDYSFWAVGGSTERNHDKITFNAIRDWMFDPKYNLETMFNPNTSTFIERAHVDDITPEGLWNISVNGDNSINEEFEDFSENQYYPTEQTRLFVDYRDDISYENESGKPRERIYYYKRKEDNIGYFNLADNTFTTLKTNVAGSSNLLWFTAYRDKNKKWHLVYALCMTPNASSSKVLLVDLDSEAKEIKRAEVDKTISQFNGGFSVANEVYDIKFNNFYSLVMTDAHRGADVRYIDVNDWIVNGTNSTIVSKFINTGWINNTIYEASLSLCVNLSYSYPIIVYSGYTPTTGGRSFHLWIQLNPDRGGQQIASMGYVNSERSYVNSFYTPSTAWINISWWCENVDMGVWRYKTATNQVVRIKETLKSRPTAFTSITGYGYKDDNIIKQISNAPFIPAYYDVNDITNYSNSNTINTVKGEFGIAEMREIEGGFGWYINGTKIGNTSTTNWLFPSYYWEDVVPSEQPKITINEVNEMLNNQGFAMVECQLTDDFKLILGKESSSEDITFTEPPKINFKLTNVNVENNYYVFLVPFGKFRMASQETTTTFNDFYKIVQASPYIYHIRFQPFPVIPKGMYKYVIKAVPNVPNDYYIEIQGNGDGTFKTIDANSSELKMKMLFKANVNAWDVVGEPRESNNASEYNTNIGVDFISNNVAKLHKNPYSKDYLKSTTGLEMMIYPQVLNNNFAIQYSYTWGVDNNHLLYKVKDLDNELGYYNSDYTYGVIGQEINNYEFVLTNEPYAQYQATNRNQLEQRSRKWEIDKDFAKQRYDVSKANRWLQGIGAVAGVGAGGGSPASVVGGWLGIGSTITGAKSDKINYKEQMADIDNQIALQKASLEDLKTAPNTLKGNGDDMNGILSKVPLTPLYIHDELWDPLKEACAWRLHMFGSALPYKSRNLNDYINTRYFFNTIKTKDIFQNFIPSINNGAKQTISNSFMDGVWIWHYHNKLTWKGVKNFNVNNVQNNLVPTITIKLNDYNDRTIALNDYVNIFVTNVEALENPKVVASDTSFISVSFDATSGLCQVIGRKVGKPYITFSADNAEDLRVGINVVPPTPTNLLPKDEPKAHS